MYLKLKADQKESSLLLVKANYAVNNGNNLVNLNAGNAGVIGYELES